MKEITLDNKKMALSINGIEFDVLISDAEVLVIHGELREKIKTIDSTDPLSILAFDQYVTSLFAKTIGENAMETISGGAPVAMARKLEWYMNILSSIDQMYFEMLVAEND